MIKNVYSDDYIGYSCNKLIRDRIPEIAINKNQFLFYRYLNSMELKDELCKKIMEEYQELIQAKTREEIVEETADLLEVLDHLYRLIH